MGVASFGRGTGQIWIDDLSCTGAESNIAACRHSGYGIHNCDHREDAGVYCPSEWKVLLLVVVVVMVVFVLLVMLLVAGVVVVVS